MSYKDFSLSAVDQYALQDDAPAPTREVGASKAEGTLLGFAMETVPGFANEVCRGLPEGWALHLEMEQGSAGLTLYDAYGDAVDPEEYTSVDCSLLQQGRAALAYAISFAPPVAGREHSHD